MQHNNSTSKALIIKMIICVLCVIFKFQVFSPAGLKMQTKLVIFNSIYSGGLPSNGDKAKIRIFYVLGKNQNIFIFFLKCKISDFKGNFFI